MQGSIGAQARRITVVAAAIVAALIVSVPMADAQPGPHPGWYDYHPNDTQYKYAGPHGTFTGDVIYAGTGPFRDNRLIWSLRLSPYVQQYVHGTMSCGASILGKPRYHDLHPSVNADYWWHSSVTELRLDTLYKFYARCDFTATNGQVSSPGSVEYTVQFTMHSR